MAQSSVPPPPLTESKVTTPLDDLKRAFPVSPRRAIIALAAGLTMTAACYFGIFIIHGHAFYSNSMMQYCTLRDVRAYVEKIEDMKTFPENLKDIDLQKSSIYPPRKDRDGNPLDHWGNPLVYHADDTTYTIIAYARDGKPGGMGLDKDINSNNLYSYAITLEDDKQYGDRPSLGNFMFRLPTKSVLILAILNGLFGIAVVTFSPACIRPGDQMKKTIKPVIVVLLAANGVSILFIAQLLFYSST